MEIFEGGFPGFVSARTIQTLQAQNQVAIHNFGTILKSEINHFPTKIPALKACISSAFLDDVMPDRVQHQSYGALYTEFLNQVSAV